MLAGCEIYFELLWGFEVKNPIAIVLASIALLLSLEAAAGDFVGTVRYLVHGEACADRDDLRICVVGGVIPTRSHEFTVKLELSNQSGDPVNVAFGDVTLHGSSDQAFVRRTVAEYESLMKQLVYKRSGIAKAVKHMFEDDFTLEAGETRSGLVRFRRLAGENDSTEPRSRPKLRGERYPPLDGLDFPLWIDVRFRGHDVGRALLHFQDYDGQNGTLSLAEFGLEQWRFWKGDEDPAESDLAYGSRQVGRLFGDEESLFVVFADGGFLFFDERSMAVCTGTITEGDTELANQLKLERGQTRGCNPRSPPKRLRGGFSIKNDGSSCSLVGGKSASWPATEPASCGK